MTSKDIDRLMLYVGICVAVIFLATILTPISNYVGARFSPHAIIRPAGAIVVLGGGVLKGDTLDDASLRRTVHGIELYKANLAPLIVFSGPARYDIPTKSEAELRTELALRLGIPRSAIMTEEGAN